MRGAKEQPGLGDFSSQSVSGLSSGSSALQGASMTSARH